MNPHMVVRALKCGCMGTTQPGFIFTPLAIEPVKISVCCTYCGHRDFTTSCAVRPTKTGIRRVVATWRLQELKPPTVFITTKEEMHA